jgi:tripartite-type tricarboxylate transporter receptor subunit TctC
MNAKKVTVVISTLLALMLVLAAGGFAPAESEINWPTRPVSMIVGFSAGGGTDIGARVLAEHLGRALGQRVVVTNIPGAGGEPALVQMLSSAPNGYTIGAIVPAQFLNPFLRDAQYSLEDFVWIGQQVNDTRVIAARPNDPRFHDMETFLAYARANPGLTVADTGIGTSAHLATAGLSLRGGLNLTPIHTEGFGQGMVLFLGAHVDLISASLGEANTMLMDGNAIIIGFTSEERHPDFPDIPTFIEAGIDFTINTRRGWVAHRDVDPRIVRILSDAMAQVAVDPQYLQDMNNSGIPPDFLSGDDFERVVFEELDVLIELIDVLGLRQE